MKYTTFERKIVDTDTIDHQHLSNIHWYNKIIYNQKTPTYVSNRLDEEFDGEVLMYRPKSTFKSEIDMLEKMGYLSWREENGLRVANINYNGHVVGEVIDIATQRQLLINQLLK